VGTYTATVTVTGDKGIAASFDLSLTVSTALNYGIALSVNGAYTFPVESLDYQAAEPLTVTVTNTGANLTGFLTVELTGADRGSFVTSEDRLSPLQPGGSRTFTVAPKPGLSKGTYTAGVMVYNEANNIYGEFGLSFTVWDYPSAAEIAAYLNSATGGATANDPVPLAIQVDTGDWAALGEAIKNSGKYVALNLSAGSPAATSIEIEAFRDCAKLVSVSFPEATSIGYGAFLGCASLTSVSFPAATSIGFFAFLDCVSLISASFPAVTSINNQAFHGCTGLTTINLPATLTSIDGNPFTYCVNLTTITVAPGNTHYKGQGGMLLTIDGTLIAYPGASGTVTLSGITSIEYRAFEGCTGLTTVNLPATLTSIEGNPFTGCVNLTTITVAPGNTHYKVQDGMLLTIDGTQLIVYPGASGTVTLPGITSIENSAFQGCTGLTSVSFPKAASIGSFAFEGCTSLTSGSFPEAASIGAAAFYTGGAALTITLGSTPPSVESVVFGGEPVSQTITVRVPSSAVTAYNTAWQNEFKGANDYDGEVNTFINLIIQGY
jgi:hypothetical protein